MNKNWRNLFNRRILGNLAVVCLGVLLFSALANFGEVTRVAAWVVSLFTPFIIGLGLAYLLNLPMRFLERTLLSRISKPRLRRVLSILLVDVLLFALIVIMMLMVVPQLVDSVVSLIGNIPSYLANISQLAHWLTQRFALEPDALDFIVVSYKDFVNQAIGMARDALPNLLNWSIKIGSGLVHGLTAIIFSIYLMFSKEKLQRQCSKLLYAILPKRRADEFLRVGSLSNKVFSGFISGKIIDSAIIGLICYVFMWITDTFFYPMPLALLISIIIGVTNIIPFFGPFIGAIPSVLLLLLVNPLSALIFTIFVIVLQQFDGNILGPKILGDSTGLPALWVLVAIIIGGGLFGFLGMILGVPTVAVLYTLASDYVNKRLIKKRLNTKGEPLAPEEGEAPGGDEPEASGSNPT